ncbi:unnamed protein product [Calypogeia fissa]
MQAGGTSGVVLPSGSDGASTSSAQAASMTTKGGLSSSIQAASLTSRGGAPTSGGQIVPLPSRVGVSTSTFVVSTNAPHVVASTSGFQGAVNPSRQRFHIELKEGETNVVSWKKLVKDAQKNTLTVASEAPAGANPALEARIAPERAGLAQPSVAASQDPLPAPTNRFSSVIEKIERLYKGVDSEEEEDDGYASVDESQYDSEDDFIDDTELDEYFSVDKAKTKHTGFFVNRGKLEKVDESPPPPLPPSPPTEHVPRKRKRNIAKLSSEIVAGEFAKKRVNIGLRLKDAARKTPGPISLAVESNQSFKTKPSEQSVIPKPQKRVQPILDERDSTVEHASMLNSDYTSRENVRDSRKGEVFAKDMDNNIQATLVEVSDDETDLVEVLKPKTDTKDRGVSDGSVPNNRLARIVSESAVASSYERTNASKSVDDSFEEKPVKDDSRETGGFAALPKIRKNQQQLKDDELKETEGSGKALSASVTSSPGNKEVSPKKVAGWPKGTVLERAINDLEKGVTEAFPLTGDRQEAIEKAESAGKSKRLPREVKQKLAKVARLAAKKGKIPDEFIERLMNIIGHVMRLKTLKRNLKSMVEMGLNAKQAKDVRLQDMKREVTELVKSKVATFRALDAEQLDGSSDDLQATAGSTERGPSNGRFKWDEATEDRVCELYDHYVEGMDEHKGPQIRKLYIELAELWPNGWMDNHGIKNAVFRAKERRKKQNKLKMGEEKRRRKAALVTDKPKADRELVLMERKPPSPPSPTVVPVLNRGVAQKEKLTIKSSKQRLDDTSKHMEERSKHADTETQISMEEARRLAVELVTRHGVEYAKRMRLAEQAAMRELSNSGSKLVKPKPILKMEGSSPKAKRTEDGGMVQRKLPRKNFEGKIVEHLARKRPRSENEDDSVETLRSPKNILNSPLMKIKKKKIRPSSDGKPYTSSDGKPYPSSRVGLSPVRISSNSDRLVNGAHTSQNKNRGISPLRGGEPERVKDVARWPSEASRLLND